MKITRRQLRQMILEQMDVTVGTGPRNREERLGIVDATQAPAWWIESGEPPLDVVDGDTGEIYAQWDDPDNWNDEPFSGMYADFVIWLGKNEEDYKKNPKFLNTCTWISIPSISFFTKKPTKMKHNFTGI